MSRPAEPGIVFHLRGRGCELSVFEQKLTLTRPGVWGFVLHGQKGVKTIPFFSITALQHKRAGLTVGYLQFTIGGGSESRGGVGAAVRDENTFVYANAADSDRVERVKAYIEQRMGPPPRTAGAEPALADEVSKLAQLKKAGLLTDDEFTAAKQKLLRA